MMYLNSKSKSRIKAGKDLFVWGFVLILMGAIAVGDVGHVPVGATGERIKLFKCGEGEDFGVRDALAMLASMCQKNIVPTPSVDGPLAFRSLSNVTFEEAMDAILGESFVYEQKGNLIKVYTKEEYKNIKQDKERMIYKLFTLYYITAQEAERLIRPVLSTDAKVQASTAAEQQISSAGGSTSGTGGSIGSGGGGDSMALHDTMVVYDYPECIARAEEVIKSLDARPKQVLVEATILSALLTEGMELGVDLNLLGGVSLTGTSTTEQVGTEAAALVTTTTTPVSQIHTLTKGTPIEVAGFATVGGSGLRVGIRTGDVSAFISALETVTDTTVLANPKILAVNKQEGSVLIGTNLGYRSSTTISTGGIATEGEVKFLQTGTQLVFRPYIGNDGYIRMDIYPKDSSATLNDDGVPTENTTQLKTNIVVKDGETIVIGGLFRDVITTTRNQVPLLGDIPLAGALFRGTTDRTQREEVIVLLTPHIIEEPSETEGVARAADIQRKRFGAKESLQWVGRARLAEDRYAEAAKYYLDGDYKAALKELSIVLTLRPTYLEAIRLKERIIGETDPAAEQKINRKMIETVEQEDLDKWLRL